MIGWRRLAVIPVYTRQGRSAVLTEHSNKCSIALYELESKKRERELTCCSSLISLPSVPFVSRHCSDPRRMLRVPVRRAISSFRLSSSISHGRLPAAAVAASSTRSFASTSLHRPTVAQLPPVLPRHHHQHKRHLSDSIMTITDPNYKPDAPYAFVTSPGSALDHLPGDAWQPVPAKDGLPPYAIYTKSVEQSPNDDRAYRLIMLENGLEAMIVSDPKTDKAAAAMDVKVGHLSDPEDLPGLAHFCEHLMFMGTEKVLFCSRRFLR